MPASVHSEHLMVIRFTDTSPSPDLPPWPAAQAQEGGRGKLPDRSTLIRIPAAVHQSVLEHLRASRLEQGGLLLGRAWSWPGSRLMPACIELVSAVAAPQTDATAYSLRMNASVWNAARERLEALNMATPDAQAPVRMIGWYHSHPSLGAFFSATDIATQKAFFTQACSLGWVIDPFCSSADRHQAFFLGPDSTAISGRQVEFIAPAEPRANPLPERSQTSAE